MSFYNNIVEIHTWKIHNLHIYLILDTSALKVANKRTQEQVAFSGNDHLPSQPINMLTTSATLDHTYKFIRIELEGQKADIICSIEKD